MADTASLVVYDVPSIKHGDIVAHSMGNLLTVEALRNTVLSRGTFNQTGELRSLILASPTTDIDLFGAQIEPMPQDLRRFYILVSRDDEALAASRFIGGGVNRVG